MSDRLKGKVAWITGGASGMGQATARLFAAEGAKVAIVDVNQPAGQKNADEIGGGDDAIFTACDVSREAAVQSSIDKTVERFGQLDIIVNCAGIAHVRQLHEYSEAEWDQLMGVNLKSIFFSVKHGIAHLRARPRSYVVNVASISTYVAQGSTPAYSASKGAVLQLTRSIAADYAKDGLRCNCVCPGITDTPLLRYHMRTMPDPGAALARRLQRVPMGVALTPHDIARSILYFSTEDSAGITGTSLIIDGGYLSVAEWDNGGDTRFMHDVHQRDQQP